MSASRRFPASRFQPGSAAMYACTGALPSAFAIWGLPPERSLTFPPPPAPGLPLLDRGIPGHRGLYERLERRRVDRLPLADIDGPSRPAFQAGIEEVLRIRQAGSMGERELHGLLVGFAGADDPMTVKHRDPIRIRRLLPFPLFDHSGLGLQDQRPHPIQGSFAPIPLARGSGS